MTKKNYYVAGMHCASCEILLEKEIKKIDPNLKCQVSHKTGLLSVEGEVLPSRHEILRAAKSCDLEIVDSPPARAHGPRNNLNDYIEMLGFAMLAIMFAVIIKKMNLERLLPDVADGGGVLIALILGAVASVSTCLVLVGGIVMSLGSVVGEVTEGGIAKQSKPHLLFHLGRFVGFVLLGGMLGLLGAKFDYSPTLTGVITILVALLMLYIGLHVLHIVPSITRFGIHMPKGFSRWVEAWQKSEHPLAPAIVGALTFFLPCGFTQSMQITAVASGSFLTGALIMGAFALGTFPALFSLGLGSSYAQNRDFGLFQKIIGVVIVLFAIYSLNSGLSLTGATVTLPSLSAPGSASSAVMSGDEQVVRMKVDWTFEPTEFRVKKGVPVRWEIEGVNVSGCTNEVIIPKLGISKKIDKGMNVVEFTPTESGNLPFSCWMGMVGGRFIVE